MKVWVVEHTIFRKKDQSETWLFLVEDKPGVKETLVKIHDEVAEEHDIVLELLEIKPVEEVKKLIGTQT